MEKLSSVGRAAILRNMKTDHPIKILMVDDKQENLLSLEVSLENENYVFVKANSGREALKILLREQDFAIILMDVQMPGLDGFETAELIRESDKLKQVPIIFLTAALQAPDYIFKGYQSGAVDYVLKPISKQILRAKVSVFTELYRQNRKLIMQGEHLKRLNRKLGKKSEDLLRINQELEAFSYSVSHDLRAPLRAVSGFAQLLEEGYSARLDAEGRKFLGIIKHNGVKMGKLIDALLAFSRLGRKEFDRKDVDMNELVRDLLAEINRTTPHKAQVILNPLPPARSNPTLMHQVMFNLISNAIKYSSKKEKPVIEIGSTDENDETIYYVKDNGAGFNMNYYNKLFGVFQRLHSNEEFEGTGIGLAMTHRIITKHGGRIWAEGKENEGATFYFTPKPDKDQAAAEQLGYNGNWEWNLRENRVIWSDELYQVYGLLPGESEISFERISQMGHPSDEGLFRKTIYEAIRTRKPFDFYHRIIRPDNTERTLHSKGEVFVNDLDDVVKVVGMDQDVTEQWHKEKMDELAIAATKSTNSVMIADHKGKIEWVNEGFEKLTGYTIDEVRSTHGEVLRRGGPSGLSPESQFFQTLIRKKEAVVYEGKSYAKDGSEFWTITTLTPMIGKDGQVERIIAIDSDITQRKKMEENMVLANQIAEHSLRKRNKVLNDLMQAKKALEESMQVKEQFLAKMSHEIRTPINAIMGLTEILLESQIDDEQKKYLEAVKISSDNLLTVINDILDFSKLESGKVSLEQVTFKLSEVIDGVLMTLRFAASRKGIELGYIMNDQVPDILTGDPYRLRQILLNLVSNSVKFTEKGSVRIDVELVDQREHDCTLRLIVRDTGIGISEEHRSAIFESFTQASNDTSRKYGGTGLGLTIVKQMTELQGGTVNVESTVGVGSDFILTLPFKKGDLNDLPVMVEEKAEPSEMLGPVSVLLAEDNEMNQMLTEKILSKWGFETTIAENGKKAIELMEVNDYDIVLMDIQMPEMDGYEATVYIRKNMPPSKAAVPIIAMTAHAIVGEAEKCISFGMDDYISKPFSQKTLYDKIDTLLRKKQRAKAAPKPSEMETATPTAEKYIDLTYLRQIAEGNDEFVRKMLTVFLQQTPRMLEDMTKFLGEKRWLDLRTVVHKMKPSLEFVGIAALKETVNDIEKYAGEQINLELIPPMVEEVKIVCTAALQELEKMMREFS